MLKCKLTVVLMIILEKVENFCTQGCCETTRPKAKKLEAQNVKC